MPSVFCCERNMPDETKGLTHIDERYRAALPNLSIIGLGKLGAPMAAVFACAGYNITGSDHNSDLVARIAEGKAPFDETDLQAHITKAGDKLRAVPTTAEAVASSDITFVIVPTPTGEDGLFSNQFLLDAVAAIGEALSDKQGYHLVVVTSTVVPGSTGSEILQALEASSGKSVGTDIGLCYSPEFIALGSVVHDMKNPDLVLIGASDEKAADKLEAVYRQTVESSPHYCRMNFVNAELAKIAINTFVTTKISYANMLSTICDLLPGADIDTISATLGADSRIGPKYLKGGAAFGGPCFPRDNKALTAFAANLGIAAHIAAATDAQNFEQSKRLVRLLEASVARSAKVCVCGLSYKTNTNVTEESAGLAIAAALKQAGHTVSAHDPMVQASAMGAGLALNGDLEEAIANVDAVLIMTPWRTYETLPQLLKERKSALTIVDPWRMFRAEDFGPQVTYIAVGRP